MKSLAFAAALLALLALPHPRADAAIIYGDFGTTNGLSLVGNVARQGSALRFEASGSPMAGAVWYGSELAVSLGFVSEFTFRMTGVTSTVAGIWNGLTFTVQDNGSPQSTRIVGGAYGYGGIGNSIAVAFVPETVDGKRTTSIRVFSGGDHDTSLVPPPPIPYPDWDDGATHTARIVYDPYTFPGLFVYLDDMGSPAMAHPFHLTSLMCPCDRRAYVGFTAGNELGTGTYEILSWRAEGVPEPGTLALIGATVLGATVRRLGMRRTTPRTR